MDTLLHYHIETGSTVSGPTLNVKCAHRDEMLRYLEESVPVHSYTGDTHQSEGCMKGSIKGDAYRFLFVGDHAAALGYEYTEVRHCAALGCP